MSGVIGTGTAIFIAISILGCIFTGVATLFGTLKRENWRIAAILTTCAVFCLWLMWITAYMHQLNPLIAPDISAEGE